MKDNANTITTFKLITLDDGTNVELKKLGLISYSKMNSVLKRLISSLVSLLKAKTELSFSLETDDSDTANQLSNMLVELFTENINTMIEFLHVCTNLEISYLQEQVGIYDAIVLIDGILEVNKIVQVTNEVKKLMSRSEVKTL